MAVVSEPRLYAILKGKELVAQALNGDIAAMKALEWRVIGEDKANSAMTTRG